MSYSVWWAGVGDRTISATDWASHGITGDSVTWNASNGWSLPQSLFNSDQLNILSSMSEFVLGQSGPRTTRPPTTRAGYSDSAYIYYRRVKDLYDALVAGGNEKSIPRVQIADNCYGAPATGGGFNISTTGTYEFFYTVGVDASDLRVGFGNWANTLTSGVAHVDIDSATSVTFSAGVKDAAGNTYALTFQGQRSVVLASGLILSDPLPVEVAKGDVIYVRVYISAGTAHWNRTCAGSGASPYSPGGFTAAGDYTQSGSPAVTAAFSAGWGPMCLVGTPTNRTQTPKAVIIQGDSIAWGAFDGLSGANYVGYNPAFPVLAGVGNQTIFSSGQNTQRVAHNAWVRDGGPIDSTTKLRLAVGSVGALRFGDLGHPIKDYLEIADVVESARDSGKFKAANRVVTDAAATAVTAIMTSATAAFTSADIGRCVIIPGAGTAAADLTATILSINSATSVNLDTAIVTTVSAKTVPIGVMTADGIHPRCNGHKDIAAAIQAPLLALTS